MTTESFPHTWIARILTAPPLIAPARQYIYPQHIPGEEDAMSRGALLVDIKPANAPNFLATCALGFTDPSLPTSIHACPRPDDLLAIAGGYAYLIDTAHPDRFTMLPFRPVLELRPLPEANLLLFIGHHAILAWGPAGQAWQSEKLSDEGVTVTSIESGVLHGLGWQMLTDKETPFTLDLGAGVFISPGQQPNLG